MSTVVDLRDHDRSEPDRGPGLPDRWQPTRAGLVNVWRYAEEELAFHRGRLLFRGPNGSGKSMALELLLPFLLDASARPGRLTSSVKSRGGLYERFMTGQSQGTRAGFIWVEFRRPDAPDAAPFTCGVRLSASMSSGGKVDLTWFTTDWAIGSELELLSETRVPLTKAALVEAIGDRGSVHRTADDYRAAVRSALFPGFSPQRYEAMILTLLTLRREKVSQDLSPQKLSEVLTSSLPPLDDGELHRAAEGFEKLDRRRANLERLQLDIDHLERLGKTQRSYAKAIMAAVAGAVRSAESKRDDVTKNERTTKAEAAAVDLRLAGLQTELDDGEVRAEKLVTEVETLHASDAYRSSIDLGNLARGRDEAADRVAGLVSKSERSESEHATALERVAESEAAVATVDANLEHVRRDLHTIAETLGAGPVLATSLEQGSADVAVAWAGSRRIHVDEVRAAVRSHGDAVTDRGRAEAGLERERRRLDDAAGEERKAIEVQDQVVDQYGVELTRWLADCSLLRPPAAGPEDPVPSLTAMASEPSQVALTVGAWVSALQADLRVRRADLSRQRSAIAAEIETAEQERQQLEEGEVVAPAPPGWRSAREEGLAGGPLWRLVDVAPGSTDDLDGIEAALEASGLLDAWVTPTGRVELADGRSDVFLVGVEDDEMSSTGAGAETLGSVLVPVEESSVPADVVHAILRRCRLVASAVTDDGSPGRAGIAGPVGTGPVLGRDGTFEVARLAGRGRPAPARYLGAAARERERVRLLDEVAARLAELSQEHARLGTELDAADRDGRVIEAESDARPTGAAVVEATADRAAASERLVVAELRSSEAKSELSLCEEEVRQQLRTLTQIAAEHHLATDESGLNIYEDALRRFEKLLETLDRRLGDAERATALLERDELDREQRRIAMDVAVADLARGRSSLRELETRLITLEETAGAAASEVNERISAAEREIRALKDRRKVLDGDRSALLLQSGELRKTVETCELERAAADDRRRETHRTYLAAVADNMVTDAGLEQADDLSTGTSILESARLVASDLERIDGSDRAVTRAHGNVQDARSEAARGLGARLDISFDSSEQHWWLLRVRSNGLQQPVADVIESLKADLVAATEEFREEERQLFDETLTGGVRREVAKRIRQANALVDRINDQLGRVRTAAAGVQVRLKWEIDPEQPNAVREARTLLLRQEARAEDRDALHQFFRARIEQAKTDEDLSATWEDRLRRVLDYRSWHRFDFQIAHRDWEGYVPATGTRLQKLSTGERSMALHLPMLASIAAHYDSGDAEIGCPRLVLLDELFVGVDVDNRDQLFELFVTWDLDAVLTSDHEWCAYRSLDGIAIHQIDGDDGGGDEPTTTTRFVWNGSARVIEPVE